MKFVAQKGDRLGSIPKAFGRLEQGRGYGNPAGSFQHQGFHHQYPRPASIAFHNQFQHQFQRSSINSIATIPHYSAQSTHGCAISPNTEDNLTKLKKGGNPAKKFDAVRVTMPFGFQNAFL